MMRDMTQQEIDALVRGYDEDRLRENYAEAAKAPGTVWHRILLAEMYRRGRQAASTEWGTLTDYATGEPLRPATREEWELSAQAVRNGAPQGIWHDDDTYSATVFVDGGPEIPSA